VGSRLRPDFGQRAVELAGMKRATARRADSLTEERINARAFQTGNEGGSHVVYGVLFAGSAHDLL
jgi:hypothetical protein